jgi:hypothetical protein
VTRVYTGPQKIRRRECARRTYAANKKKFAEKNARYRAINAERERSRKAAWYAANPEKRRAVSKAWKDTNPEKVRAQSAAWYTKNAKKSHAAVAAWYRAHPDAATAKRTLRRVRTFGRARRFSHIERTCIRAFYDTARFLKEITGETFHVDHVIPLSKGGLHHPRNLQVLRGVDNLRKGARI